MKPFFHYLSVLLFFVLLSAGLGSWSGLGSHIHQLVSEMPLLMLLYYFMYSAQKTAKPWLSSLVALWPITSLYFTYDYFFILFNRPFVFSELSNFSEFIQVITLTEFLLILILLVLPWLVLLWRVDYLESKKYLISLVLTCTFLFSIVVFVPNVLIGYVKSIYPGNFFEHTLIMDNGRFIASFYNEAKRRVVLASLHEKQLKSFFNKDLSVKAPRDVHIIVLESFINLKDFHNIQVFDLDNEKKSFNRLKSFTKDFSHSVSPVFGGSTARAEFEILCGLPSFAKYGSSEFGLMSGSPLSCLPNRLKKAGYGTYASNPYKPSYFNQSRAYSSLGFEKSYFLQEFSGNVETYFDMPFPPKGEGFPSDMDVFSANLGFVKRVKEAKPNQPILNYLITLWGHTPFERSKKLPNTINLTPNVSRAFNRSANNAIYTTQALKIYIKALQSITPEAIILVVGDHLPPLPNGSAEYKQYGYLGGETLQVHKAPMLFIIGNEINKLPRDVHHFHWPAIIVDVLEDGFSYKSGWSGDFFQKREYFVDDYDALMYQAIGGS